MSSTALLAAAIDALTDAAPGELSGVALAEELVALHRLSCRLSAQIVARVAVFHTRGAAAADGCACPPRRS